MSAHKKIDRICVCIIAITLVIALLFCCGKAFGIETYGRTIGYENRLFDRSRVHTIDIVIDDWDSFIETCESELYSVCSVIIDGEKVKNVGIRGKGNTSLSSVKNSGSSRYSFKIEFDQYDSTKSYHGLDKLCLNNIIQDTTYMKDYLAYTLMYDFGVDAPMCSFAYITVNGEDWGLYLAVEAIEDSFLERNYGSNYGDLYKPDSLSFGGGGPGNGKNFNMTDFINENSEASDEEDSDEEDEKSGDEASSAMPRGAGNFDMSNMPGGFGGFDSSNMPGNFDMSNMPGGFGDFDASNMPSSFGDFDFSNIPGFGGNGTGVPSGSGEGSGSGERTFSKGNGGFGGMGGFGGGFGMGSSDVKLQYIDDDPDSYTNIFNNAKTTVNKADKSRLISSLKALSEQSDMENTVNVDEVLRYFVVHLFLCNGDSYTGSMIHNYYLYEKNGQLSMIPWDYNLAYGSFSGGNGTSSVNSAIDTPISGDMSDRPMLAWIFDNEEYTEKYHELFREFLSTANISQRIDETAALIDSYVEKDPTKFCTYEDFLKGVETIKQFCELRSESVQCQLDGTIPSTTSGQNADSSSLIDASSLNISDMGSMGGGNGGGFSRSDRGSGRSEKEENTTGVEQLSDTPQTDSEQPLAGGFGGGNMPEGFDPSQFGGGNLPEGFDPSQFGGGNMPEGFDPSQFGGGNMPEGFDSSQFSGGNRPSRSDEEKSSGSNSDGGASDDSGSEDKGNVSTGSDNGQNEIGTTGADKTNNGTSSTGKAGSDSFSSGKGSTDKAGADFSRSSGSDSQRRNFDSSSFSGFSGSAQTDSSTEYILLGASALVLVLGIIVARLYKRRK